MRFGRLLSILLRCDRGSAVADVGGAWETRRMSSSARDARRLTPVEVATAGALSGLAVTFGLIAAVTPVFQLLFQVATAVPLAMVSLKLRPRAAVAAFADGPSALRNIGQLRGHETDRLAALVAELTKIGAKAQIEGDDLLIEPGPPRPATIETYADHRMATFGAILGLRIPGLRVVNVETTAKTFPQFVDMWEDLAAGAEDVAPAPLGDIFGHAGLEA